MTNYSDYLYLISHNLQRLEESGYREGEFSPDEDCPYGEAAFSTIRRGITIYREETIHQQTPQDVHIRLRRVIRQQWSILYDKSDDII